MNLLLFQCSIVPEQGCSGEATGAGPEHAQILAAGNAQDHVDGFFQGFNVGGQAPFALGLGRIAPADHKGLHMTDGQVASKAFFRRQVKHVKLVDLWRNHQYRALVDFFSQRLVLDQLQHFVAEDH